ncbi:MAG: NAD(P)H-hydrate dehydratase [Desulfomonilia bacterium]
MKVSTVSEMREMDAQAIHTYGISAPLLMENAGIASFSVIKQEFDVSSSKFLVFCGIGNNGGDGFVVARKIHSEGGSVEVCIIGDRNKYTGSAASNLAMISRMPIPIREVKTLRSLRGKIDECDLIIDAIFGTGLTRNVEGIHRDIIDLISRSGKPVLSLDIPSGINGDTGTVMGAAVRADFTVTFGLPKVGNLLYPGYEHCGSLYVSHISFPPTLCASPDLKIEVNTPPKLPPRSPSGHKGDFGEALFIAGAAGYFGAPYFAALSFLRAGGGYSRLAAPRSIVPFIASKGSEIVFIPQDETADGSISLANTGSLLEIAEKMDIVVIGPGLSLNDETSRLVVDLAEKIHTPLLIDGDGITAITQNLGVLKKRNAGTILTPHLGEMSRITQRSVSEIHADKIGVLRETSRILNSLIVLKGAHSLIGVPDGRIFINMTGNSGMATAGSGDVLTGTIAAMFCLGLTLEDATRKGVFIHGAAGDLASANVGEDGMTAQDILEFTSQAVQLDRESLFGDVYSVKCTV